MQQKDVTSRGLFKIPAPTSLVVNLQLLVQAGFRRKHTLPIALFACQNGSSGVTRITEREPQGKGKALTKCLAGN